MKQKIMLFVVMMMLSLSQTALAQFGPFGKNKVNWRDEQTRFYQSEHFDVYHWFDTNQPNEREHLRRLVSESERSYAQVSALFGHELSHRVPVVATITFSQFENLHIVSELMPEGVGAYVEWERGRLVTREDFSPPLAEAIRVHELVHVFQFDMMNRSMLGRIMNLLPLPLGFIEGGAEFIASKFAPHTRDDVRSIRQRADAANPELYLPTWEAFRADAADPYGQWFMVFEFLEARYGAGIDFQIDGLSNSGDSLGEIIERLTTGAIKNPDRYPEEFDQIHRDFWRDKYAREFLDSARPYTDTEHFSGRTVTPRTLPYGVFSSAVSPDGSEIAAFARQANGISLLVFPVPEEYKYVPPDADPETSNEETERDERTSPEIVNLTSCFPPNIFEYIVSQRQETWPFNGFDVDWSPDGTKIAFFARSGRDHNLFIADRENPGCGNLLEIEIPYDQAFSPAWSPDSGKIYFSAAENATRDIFVIDLATQTFLNLTNDSAFDTAPAMSPDGTTLAYVSVVGDFQKLFILDSSWTWPRQQLTYNRSNEDSPSFSSDSQSIVYTSDKEGGRWNVYSMMIGREVVQLTDFFGGAFTPQFSPLDPATIYYTIFWQYDQFRGIIYPNYEAYEAILKKPYDTFVMEDRGESMEYSFEPEEAVARELDEQQLLRPIAPPPKWRLQLSDAMVGFNSYWGGFGGFSMRASDILEEREFAANIFYSGGFYRDIAVGYFNREKRLQRGYVAYNNRWPLRYLYFNPIGGEVQQPIIGLTTAEEVGAQAFYSYPRSKFERIEFGAGVEKRVFDIFGSDEQFLEDLMRQSPGMFRDNDRQFFNFFQDSEGTNVNVFASYVRDTVLYSNLTQGPLHGNAFRVNVEVSNYVSASMDYRRYKRLSEGSVLAFRLAGLASSRPTGDFVLLGGDSTLRAYPYGALAGNQVWYGSVEYRFPLIDAIVFPKNTAVGPLRGFLFADYGLARFSDSPFRAQTGASLGMGFNFAGLNFVWACRQIDDFKCFTKDTYVGFNF